MSRAVKKEPSETTLENIQFHPLHALHFEELHNTWEADRRIPSVSSRRAWAEARNLNPTNVHSWWYRRRPLARKLKIKIPREEYELDVGVPPIVPETEEVIAEISTKMNEVPSSEPSDVGSDMESSSLLGISDTQTSSFVTCVLDRPSPPKNPLFEELSAEMSAYIRSSSPPSEDFSWLVPSSTPSRDSSLPSSSPPPTSTSPPCLLTFPEDMAVGDEIIGPSNHFLDPTSTEHKEICSSTSYVPHSFSDRLPRIKTSEITKREFLPLFPTWCFSGYRISYDGSFLGFCSCFTDDKNC